MKSGPKVGSPVVGGRGSRILGFVAAGSGSGGRGYTCHTGRRRTRKTSLICLHGQAKPSGTSPPCSLMCVCVSLPLPQCPALHSAAGHLKSWMVVGICPSLLRVRSPSPVTLSLCRTVESRNFSASDVARVRLRFAQQVG